MKKMAYEKTVTESVLYVLKTSDSDSNKSRMDFRVVSWNYGKPTLELRSYYRKDGKWLCGRAHGFRDTNLAMLFDPKDPKAALRLKKVMRLLALSTKEEIIEAENARKAKVAA